MRPILRKTLNRNRWWALFNTAANFAYDLSNNRYMRSGGASTQALSLTETRASSAMVLQSNGTYVERVAGELAIGQGVGLQVSEEVVNLFANPTLQGQTSWIAGGDGNSDLTANAGVDPTGAQVASMFENQSAHNYGSQFYQGVAIVDTEMTISLWAYAAEEVAASLKLNDNENNHDITIGTTMQRFDHTGTIGPALLGGVGRCGFATGEDWRGKGVVIAWLQITVGKAAPFALGTRAADNPVVVQGAGGVPWDGYDLATGVTFQQVFTPSDVVGIEAFTFSDGTSDNYLIVRRGAGGGVEIEAYLAGVLTFSAESSTAFPTNLAAIGLYMKQGATVTVALDGVVLSDITQVGKTLADYSQVSLACGAGTSTIKEVYGK